MGDTELVQPSIDDFIRQFVQVTGGEGISDTWFFERLKTHKHSVMPFFGTQVDAWMILGQNRSQLDNLMRLVSRALVPSYAVFSTSFPQMLSFSKDSELHKTGRQLFVGYYRLTSLPQDRQILLKILADCFRLQEEAQAQVVEARPQVSYRELYEDFQQALVAHDWDNAEHIIQAIDSNHLTTAENLNFLRVAWLAGQERWSDIWNYDYYKRLAQLPLPRTIRGALITAFHYTQLLNLEHKEDWDALLQVVDLHRPDLSLLLSGRFGLKQPAVLRTFAYLAACDKDIRLFQRVQEDVPATDYQTRLILDQLQRFFTVPQRETSLEERIQQALEDSHYEEAWELSQYMLDPTQKTAASLQIAYLSQNIAFEAEALQRYERLFLENQRRILELYPDCNRWIAALRKLTTRIHSWNAWFDAAREDVRNASLQQALDNLPELEHDSFWKVGNVTQLLERIVIVSNQDFEEHRIYRIAIQKLVRFCLSDERFPRIDAKIAEFYDYLHLFVAQEGLNATSATFFLRLQEGVLANDGGKLKEMIDRAKSRFSEPKPIFAPYVLESLELFFQYGADAVALHDWYRQWVDKLLDSDPDQQVASNSEWDVWSSFGRWMKVSSDLLESLHQRIAKQTVLEQHPLTKLRAGYQIVIFSFDKSSAERAKNIMLGYNAKLDIRVCTEKDSSKVVESLARNSDAVILVTTCISHAISYVVVPYAEDRLIRPKSRGAASILQAMHDYLTQR